MNLLSKFIKNFNLKFGFCKLIIEFLAIIFNCLNPEIMLHASTNMPYNFASITTLIFLLILIPPDIKNSVGIRQYQFFFKLPLNYFILLAFLSTLFSFQSIILFASFFLTCFINLRQKISKINLEKLKLKKIFNYQNHIQFFQKILFFKLLPFAFLLSASYFIKFINLFENDTKPGI